MHQHRILILLVLLCLTLAPPLIHAGLFTGPVWLPFFLWAMLIFIAALLNLSGKNS